MRRVGHLVLLAFLSALISRVEFVASAQTSDDRVHVCVGSASDTSAQPYLITIRATTGFGLLVPVDSIITVYTAGAPLVADLYAIATDAASGGYRTTTLLSTNYAQSNLPVLDFPCRVDFPEQVGEGVLSTISFPTSARHAVFIQKADTYEQNIQITGVFSFHVRQNGLNQDFQLMQLRDGSIEIQLPHIGQDTSIALISNKRVGVRRSFQAEDTNFTNQTIANDRSLFVQELAGIGLELFSLMDTAGSHLS